MSTPSNTSAQRLSPRDRIAIVGFLAALVSTAALLWLEWYSVALFEHPWAVVLLAVAFAGSERLLVSIEARKQAVAYTPSEVALAIGILMLGPIEVVLARLIGTIPSMAVKRGSPPFKLAYNASMMCVEATIAMVVYRLLGSALGSGVMASWLALTFSISLGLMAGGVMVAIAIAQFDGGLNDRLRQAIVDAPVMLLPPALFAVTVAIPMATDWRLGLLATTPLPLLWLAFQSHGRLLGRFHDLSSVHHFTRSLGGALDLADIADRAATQLAEQLRADHVAVRLWNGDGGPIDELRGIDPMILPARGDSSAWTCDLSRQQTMSPQQLNEPDRRRVIEAGHHNALLTVLADDDGPLGVVVVDGRGGVSRSFLDDDIERMSTMAQQLSVVVRKGRLHHRVAFEAAHDRLTALPNRGRYEQCVDETLEQGRKGAVLLVDLDRFKQINDTFGHQTGDALLVDVAARISGCCSSGIVVARFGGDEFAVFAPDMPGEEAQRLADRICAELEETFELGSASVAIGASIGISLLGRDGSDVTSLLRAADLAMYDAKRRRTRSQLYHPGLRADTAERLLLLDDLRVALREGQLNVHYQPQLEVATGLVCGAEALARWEHPRLGRIGPDVFIELAEQSGLIDEVTRQVLADATMAAAKWHAAGQMLRVSINVSAQSLMDERLVQLVADALMSSGVDPSLVVLEITESTAMGDASQIRDCLERLGEMGVRLSVDDFGTGFSSLVNLRRLDVDEIKIDKSFVVDMILQEEDEVIVRSTIDLGHNLGLTVVAEGVETPVAMSKLRDFGCDVIQGYGISRPLPLVSFDRWLTERVTVTARDLAKDAAPR